MPQPTLGILIQYLRDGVSGPTCNNSWLFWCKVLKNQPSRNTSFKIHSTKQRTEVVFETNGQRSFQKFLPNSEMCTSGGASIRVLLKGPLRMGKSNLITQSIRSLTPKYVLGRWPRAKVDHFHYFLNVGKMLPRAKRRWHVITERESSVDPPAVLKRQWELHMITPLKKMREIDGCIFIQDVWFVVIRNQGILKYQGVQTFMWGLGDDGQNARCHNWKWGHRYIGFESYIWQTSVHRGKLCNLYTL